MTKKKDKSFVDDVPVSDASVPEDQIGSRIRSAREARGLSQTAVATRTKMSDPKKQGISRTVLVGYEAGHSKPGAREIRLLCEILGITPNWLIYGVETTHETAQASLDAFRHNADLTSAIRLSMAICVLRPHERSAFTSLVLSMAGRELGDLKLSSLFAAASMISGPIANELKAIFPDDFEIDISQGMTLESLFKLIAESGPVTNIGNKITLDEDGEPAGGEWLYPEPKK